MGRFEVLGRKADRELIPFGCQVPGGRRTGGGSPSDCGQPCIAGESPRKGGILKLCDAPRWSGPTSFPPVHSNPVVRSICDPISSRYQHHQQHHQNRSLPGPCWSGWLNKMTKTCSFPRSPSVRLAGVLEKPAGRNRDQLEAWFAGREGPPALFAGRVPVRSESGRRLGRLMAEGKGKGRPRSALDTIIAATAEANGCVTVTDNEKTSPDVEVVNPLRREPR